MDVPLGREISVLQTPDARAIYRDNWDSSIDLLNTEELGAKADVHPRDPAIRSLATPD
jgi:hypothetical protein